VTHLAQMAAVVLLACLGDGDPAPTTLSVRLVPGQGEHLARAVFDLEGLTPAQLAALRAETDVDPALRRSQLDIRRDDPGAGVLDTQPPAASHPVAGTYRVTGNALRFIPNAPLARGVRYRAIVRPARLPGASAVASPGPITVFYTLPPVAPVASGTRTEPRR
jgi:hypothetical protein